MCRMFTELNLPPPYVYRQREEKKNSKSFIFKLFIERERESGEEKFSIMHKFYDVITLLPREFAAALRRILLFV